MATGTWRPLTQILTRPLGGDAPWSESLQKEARSEPIQIGGKHAERADQQENPDEYEQVRIPGVTLIPLSELGERIDDVPTGQKVYVVCAVGGRSLAAAKALNQAGFEAVSVAGGTKAWVAEGRPHESGPSA